MLRAIRPSASTSAIISSMTSPRYASIDPTRTSHNLNLFVGMTAISTVL